MVERDPNKVIAATAFADHNVFVSTPLVCPIAVHDGLHWHVQLVTFWTHFCLPDPVQAKRLCTSRFKLILPVLLSCKYVTFFWVRVPSSRRPIPSARLFFPC